MEMFYKNQLVVVERALAVVNRSKDRAEEGDIDEFYDALYKLIENKKEEFLNEN